MNSTHPLILLKIISSRVCKKMFLIKAKTIFCTGCPKSALRGGKTIFSSYRGIRKKMFVKVTNLQVWVAWRFLEERANRLMASDYVTYLLSRQVVYSAAFCSQKYIKIMRGIWKIISGSENRRACSFFHLIFTSVFISFSWSFLYIIINNWMGGLFAP